MKITPKEFNMLREYIKKHYGINLGNEKKALVIGRLHKVLEEMKFGSFTDYYEYLIKDNGGERANQLADRITTNHTYFMRESNHFYFFRDEVLPYLKGNVRNQDLRIWSAACSTGEEPYTLAMIIDEFFGKEKFTWDTKILATDLSDKVLNIGKRGMYSLESTAPLPNYWKINYMERQADGNLMFRSRIKDEIIFRKFNLMDDFPFKKKFHVVFLRNVMIYFDNPTKDKLIQKVYDFLEPGGYLFIGHSEAINREGSSFNYIKPSIYRK